MGNCWVVWMDWEWIGKGLIYMAKWVFLKLLGKLRGLWEMNEVGREGFGAMGMDWVVIRDW